MTTLVAQPKSRPYPLRVSYDAKSFTDIDRGTGKGAYLYILLRDIGHDFVGIAPNGENSTDYPLRHGGTSHDLLWQQTALPAMLRKLKPQIFIASNNTAPILMPRDVKLVSIVYDLILLQRFEKLRFKSLLRAIYRAWLLRHTIRKSSHILTCSETTAKEIEKLFPGKQISTIHCTVAPSWFVGTKMLPLAEREPFVLIVTGNVAHKNLPRALEGFAHFKMLNPPNDIKLRMVGVSRSAERWLSMAEKLGVREHVVVEPYLSETELQRFYRTALCAFVPSQAEGFGIPALEAMASGTPLVCSNASSLPEVGGSAPLYFDPLEPREMGEALFSACADEVTWNRLATASIARAQSFHPDRIHEEVKAFWCALPGSIKDRA